MNLEKRIKRRVIGQRHEFMAVTLPGHEHLCMGEIEALAGTLQVTATIKGGVCFSGRLSDLYLASLYMRTAGRILMRLARFKATNFQQLEKQGRNIDWELFLPEGAVPEVNVTTRHSRLYHSKAVAQHMANAIRAHWDTPAPAPAGTGDQTLFVRLENDEVTLSLDCSGAPLYRRGLKTHPARAPLRETTAAGILMLAGYRPDRPLLDPMCGAGTFSLEAALMAKNIPPGLQRPHAFMQWPAFRSPQWGYLKKSGQQQTVQLQKPAIQASDVHGQACAALLECVRHNGLDDAIAVSQQDFFSLQPESVPGPPGLVVLNPPYGRRVAAKGELGKFYQEIAGKLKQDFQGWQAALIVPQAPLAKSLGLALKPVDLQHGGLDLTLLVGRI